MDIKLYVTAETLRTSLVYLKKSGERRHEGVVLWLGRRSATPMLVTHVYQPEHRAAEDFFHIPPSSMTALMGYLEKHEVSVLAQVHTHPGRAYHSKADDQWALVRHLDALSLVLPHFASATTPENFLNEAAIFSLRPGNKWTQVARSEQQNVIGLAK